MLPPSFLMILVSYLESRIAEFYERAGIVRLSDGKIGSITIGGTVSPAGGNFEEPVTQATLKVVGAFHGLSRERSDARKYPAIDPLTSWSKYPGIIESSKVNQLRSTIHASVEVNQMMKVVGEEGTSINDYVTYQLGELLDTCYLQQNSFDPIDASVSVERQKHIFSKLSALMNFNLKFETKSEVRQTFNTLRQLFLDWNNTVYESAEFTAIEARIDEAFKALV